MGLEWMERLAKQQERLEAQRRRIRGQYRKESELKLTPPIEEDPKPKRRKGWKTVEMSKPTAFEDSYSIPESSDALSKKRIAKEGRFSGKWDKRKARWEARTRKFRR